MNLISLFAATLIALCFDRPESDLIHFVWKGKKEKKEQ